MSFRAWFVRDPKLDKEINCAKIKEIDGRKFVVTSDCDVKGSAFFCKKSIVDYPMCPEGWSYDAGRYHFLILNKRKLSKAIQLKNRNHVL